MPLAAGCDRRSEPLPFEWPEQAASKHDWGLERLAPATGTLTTRLTVTAGKQRDDRWQFAIQGALDGCITHEMTWRGPRLKLRREREEAVLEAGKLRTRTLGPEYVQWPDDSRWRQLMARPATDWEGLLARIGASPEVKTLERDSRGVVVAAQLAGGGDGWRAELTWSTQPADKP